jgi:1-acyl-sn-glycerol-3-phosphate acyltransferase
LIFPGGDHEAFRSIFQANTVDFGGRVGFLRIARDAGVPIVPMGIRGSHFTAPILWQSRAVLPTLLVTPRLLGVKRYPLTVLAVLGIAAVMAFLPVSLPWRILVAWTWFASVLPPLAAWVPWAIRFRIGKPLPPEELFAGGGDPEKTLRAALIRVQGEVAALVAR